MNLKIRKFETDDLDEVFALLNILYKNKLDYYSFVANYKNIISNKNNYNIVAIYENKIVGVLTLR